MATTPIAVGIIGCGAISDLYFRGVRSFDILDIQACADLIAERADAKAEASGVRACSVQELLSDPEIQIVINLTVPGAHGEIGIEALQAGKSLYNEKPLAISRADGSRLLEIARKKDLRVGGAPDTFMGGGIQTCRKLVDDGWIGEPVAANAFMMCRGHERWHSNPDFFYQPGGGPMFDMGPYYLTALIVLMGPVRRVTCSARASFPERTITSQPRFGTKIQVNTPTHLAGVLDFASGAIGSIVTSFDVWGARLPYIEIYGSEGSLSLPDPNGFGGTVRIRRPEDDEWREVPLTHGYTEQSRGLGIADMAHALRSGRPHRASGEMAYHVLDIMNSFLDASLEGRHVDMKSTCDRPDPLPVGTVNNPFEP